ncbi:MAG TPA: CHASE2 domain-containing protein [Verrucomicrobiota bacterium]|nr:CHASE2 domain-containing protein [Verrucomicrobiota bacterium]
MSNESTGSLPTARSGAARRRAHLLREFVIAAVVLVVFTVFKLWFEGTEAGHWLHAQSHVWLQSKVKRDSDADIPVVVVDISRLKPVEYAVTWTNPPNGSVTHAVEHFTSREALSNLVVRIANVSPVAIGVDVDLSFEPELIPGPELLGASTNLFETALALGASNSTPSVPVFLGIKRTEGLPPEHWLLNKRYIPLAASLARPVGEVHHMPSEFQFPGHLHVLPGLARALVPTNVNLKPSPVWLRHFTKRISTVTPLEDAPNFKFTKYPVDYTALDNFVRNRVMHDLILNATAMSQVELLKTFGGKIVILGDATLERGADTAIVAFKPEPVPGVYVHASAANTLLQSPLWELKTWVGLLLAFIGSMSSLYLIYSVCTRYAEKHHVTTVPLTILLTFVLIAFFVLVAVALARWFHVLWLEMIAVCIVLLLDCLFDVLFGTVSWKHLRKDPLKSVVVSDHE